MLTLTFRWVVMANFYLSFFVLCFPSFLHWVHINIMVRKHHMSILKQAKTNNKQNLKVLCKKVTIVSLFFFWVPAVTFWLVSQTLVCSSQSALKIANPSHPWSETFLVSLLLLLTGEVQTWRLVGPSPSFRSAHSPFLALHTELSSPNYLLFTKVPYTF